MIDRRTWLAGAMAGGVTGWAAPSVRLNRTNIGQGIFWLTEILPGDRCTVLGKTVYWRGHLLGVFPMDAGDIIECRIASAGLDEDGCSDIRVRT